jgi:hypothetical protein
MSVHLHRARQWTAWTLSAVALSPLALCLDSPAPVSACVPVTGHVTYSGRPLNETFICLDLQGQHLACGHLRSDGSFHLVNMTSLDSGACPGRYRAHLFSLTHRPKYPSKYEKPETSDLDLDVAPGWNDFRIELH